MKYPNAYYQWTERKPQTQLEIDMYNISVSPTGGWNFLPTLETRDMLIANITFDLKLLTLFFFLC